MNQNLAASRLGSDSPSRRPTLGYEYLIPVSVAEFFGPSPGCHFSGRIFFHLGRNREPRLKSLGAKKKEAIFEASFCTHPNTNIINEMITSFFFFFWQ